MPVLSKKIVSLQFFIFAILGLVFGVAASHVAKLPSRTMVVVLMALIFPLVAAMVGDVRRFLLWFAAFVIPFRIDINFKHLFENQAGASTVGISIHDVFVILLFLWLFIEIATKTPITLRFFPRLTIPAILFFEMCLLTLLWAPRLDLATMQSIAMAKVLIMYWVIANHLREERDLRLICWALLAAVFLQSLIAVLQFGTGRTLGLDFLGEAYITSWEGGKLWRVMGTLGHPNRLAMYLELLLPLCLGMFFVLRKSLLRFMAILTFAIGFAALIMTGSRGGWIVTLVALVVFYSVMVLRRRVTPAQLAAPFLGAVAIIVLAVFLFSDIIEKRVMGDDYGSAMSRIPMIQIALNVISAHPVGGVGINNYQVVMQDYNDTIMGRGYLNIDRPVHNMYLLIAGESGLLGLVAFLSLLISVFVLLYRSSGLENRTVSIIAISLLCGFAAQSFHGMVDKHAPGNYPLFYLMMALAVVLPFIQDSDAIEVVESS